MLIICGGALLALLLIALAAPLIAPHDPLLHHPQARFVPPGDPLFLLGTDNHGRDILSRLLFGARSTLITALLAVTIATMCGILLGCGAALAPPLVDTLLALLIDTLLAFPLVILSLILLSTVGGGILSVALALGIAFTPLFARHFRLETRALLQRHFVLAALAIGARRLYILWVHLLPNLLPKTVLQMALNMVLIISVATALSFLGFGAIPPAADWGLMLREARSYLHHAPWMALFPGGILLLTNLLFQISAEFLARRI